MIQGENLLITILASTAGAIIGAFITYYLNYVKTKATMKWDAKYKVYNEILEFDKVRPGTNSERNQEIRFANRLKLLSAKEEFKKLANKIIENKFDSLADKQKFIDEEFIPAMERDLEDTINIFRW